MGATLAEARPERGLKQCELAELSGVDQGDISRIQRGVLAPTTRTLLRLAEGLNARITLELIPT
ncbi:MAG: helix-turn-helix domain-containing protein [Mycobacteriales bacterium]